MMTVASLAAPLSIGGVTLRNRVFLAPMSGVSDAALRGLADSHGAGLVVSEMIAGGELAKGRQESVRRMRRPDVGVHMVQIAGREPRWMAEAARIAEAAGADIVDINMGCPARKVTGGHCGSALMREPDHALSIVSAVVAAVDVPVTLKMRLGWDETTLNAPVIARRAEEAGVRMITVHGRTRCQFYKGRADWRAIGRVKRAVSVPVAANGDIFDLADAGRVLAASGADAVMVGRAHYGAPWTAGVIAAAAAGKVAPGVPDSPARLSDYVLAHYEEMLGFYGRDCGIRHARKHLGWYLDLHAPRTSPERRRAIMTGTDTAAVRRTLRAALAGVPGDTGFRRPA